MRKSAVTVLALLLTLCFFSPGVGDANAFAKADSNSTGIKWLKAQLAAAGIDANNPALQETPDENDVNTPEKPQQESRPEIKNIKAAAQKKQTSALGVHALCAEFLATYVNDTGMVDYKTLRRKRLELISVLNDYSLLDPNIYAGWTKQDQLAFWINTYNLCIIKEIVDNYPIEPSRFKMLFYPANSIMQIFGWERAQFNVMGENYTLTEMEQKIIRRFDEPRVCLAINYGCLGCVPLRREPYIGRNLGEQLDDQARRFLAADKGFRIDRDEPALYLSALFEWYGKEFESTFAPGTQFTDKSAAQAAVLNYLSKLVSKKDADWMVRKMYPVKFMRFNWVLNEQH